MGAIRYLVNNVDEAATFYSKNLGFVVEQRFGAAMAVLTREDLTLWLAGPAASAARPMPDGRRPQPGGWNRFVLQVKGLESMVGTLRGAGVAFRNDIVRGPGGAQILCEDPSGNVVELFESAGAD